MKKLFILGAFFAIANSFGQAFDGYGDNKTLIGLTKQSGGTGIVFNFDRGLNDHISFGSSFGFIVSTDTKVYNTDGYEIDAKDLFAEKIDFNFRVNGHFGKEIGFSEMMDLYGGLNLGARNIGAQVGYTFLITDGFGFYTEAAVPIYKYQLFGKDSINYYDFYNQPVFSIGIVISN